MTMIYLREKTPIKYNLLTDPPDAVTWSTYTLKKSHIKLLDKFDRSTAAVIKQEIFDDIIRQEGNPPQKPNRVSKEHKAADVDDVKVRPAKRKTRKQSVSKKVEKLPAVQPNARRKRNVPR